MSWWQYAILRNLMLGKMQGTGMYQVSETLPVPVPRSRVLLSVGFFYDGIMILVKEQKTRCFLCL